MADKISASDWKKKLSPQQYEVLRQKGTEEAFSGVYYAHKDKGAYSCAGCGAELFESTSKFDSGTGWPSFDKAKKGAVEFHKDKSLGMERVEVTCTNCGGHLGHMFEDGPSTTGKRFCINSCSLKFNKKNGKK